LTCITIVTKSRDNGPRKGLRGYYPHDFSQQYVDIEASNKWLTNADLFAETEGLLTAIQDQVVLTRNYKKYRVISKSVKHFKNSQQINYSTDHGSSYAGRERNSPSFFLHISQMLNVSTFGNMADICAIVHLVLHACQHITVDQSHSSGDTVAKIWRLVGSGGTKTVSFTNPQKKKLHGVKSRDWGGHCINASSSFPVCPIHLCGKFRLRHPRTSL